VARPVVKLHGIRRAAMELFVEKGIEGTTIRDIALRARAAEGTMYRHFPGKEALALAIFLEELEALLSDLERIVEEEASCRETIFAMIREFYAFFEDDPVRFSYLLLSEHAFLRRLPEGTVLPTDLLRGVLRRGIASGELRRIDPDLATAYVFGIVARVPLFKITGKIRADLRELAPEVARDCWILLEGDER